MIEPIPNSRRLKDWGHTPEERFRAQLTTAKEALASPETAALNDFSKGLFAQFGLPETATASDVESKARELLKTFHVNNFLLLNPDSRDAANLRSPESQTIYQVLVELSILIGRIKELLLIQIQIAPQISTEPAHGLDEEKANGFRILYQQLLKSIADIVTSSENQLNLTTIDRLLINFFQEAGKLFAGEFQSQHPYLKTAYFQIGKESLFLDQLIRRIDSEYPNLPEVLVEKESSLFVTPEIKAAVIGLYPAHLERLRQKERESLDRLDRTITTSADFNNESNLINTIIINLDRFINQARSSVEKSAKTRAERMSAVLSKLVAEIDEMTYEELLAHQNELKAAGYLERVMSEANITSIVPDVDNSLTAALERYVESKIKLLKPFPPLPKKPYNPGTPGRRTRKDTTFNLN